MAVEPSAGSRASETAAEQPFQVFHVHPPLLEQGKMTTTLATTDLIAVQVAVGRPGGETVFHYHTGEDQIFLVLAGQARFYTDEDAEVATIGQFQGILVPRLSRYWFESASDEMLVYVRVGAKAQNEPMTLERLGPPLKAPIEVKVLEGQFFGD
jgi:mannose-6-phosphate isomerase-like protein (cupin superfamily)